MDSRKLQRKPGCVAVRTVGLSGWPVPDGSLSWGGSYLRWDTSYLYWGS